MDEAINWLKGELSYALKVYKESCAAHSLRQRCFWDGRIYTLRRCIRQLQKQ